jgi:hypothetical protein
VSTLGAKRAQTTQNGTEKRDGLSQYLALYYMYLQGVAETLLVGL